MTTSFSKAASRMVGVAIATASLVLVGCGSSGAPQNDPAPTTSAPATTPAAESTTTGSADSLTKEFGSTFTWDSGAAITVGAPKPFTPTYTDLISGDWDEFVVVEVTLTNGTDEPQSPMNWTIRATSGDKDAESVYDSEALGDTPSADILPGKTSKFNLGFGRTAGADFVVQVDWNFGLDGDSGYYK